MPFLASNLSRSSRILSTGQNLIALEQFASNSPFIALTALTNIDISTSKVCILLGASQQTRYGEQWINTQRFRISEV